MPKISMAVAQESSYLNGNSAAYIETLYEQYLQSPSLVDDQWQAFFQTLTHSDSQDIPHSVIREHFAQLGKAKKNNAGVNADLVSQATDYERKQVAVLSLVSAFRHRGHQQAKIDPLGLLERELVPDLGLQFHGLSQADYDTVFQTGPLFLGQEKATLREIHRALEQTYCQSVGAEFMHMVDTEKRHWIQQHMEQVRSAPQYSASVKKHLLERLTAAEGLEKYLASRYPGTKRFGLEGGEALIPMLDEMIQRSGANQVKEIVIGMAHRGRLNVLVNILGKKPAVLFDEFEGKALYKGSADVKYHQGFSSNVMTEGGPVHLAMAFNPSHLEIVSPVVEGSVRARQDRRKDDTGASVLPIVMHGDASFSGQGVVMETFQMSQTRAYGTGGTVHIVINNQIGFTTSKKEDARSTEYCTAIAKMVQAPIFHVNGDDPEAVLFVTKLAVDFRLQFKTDVVIDLVCYRRLGHNEADEPAMTQPQMYHVIRKHPSVRHSYAAKLIEQEVISAAQDKAAVDDFRDRLDHGLPVAAGLVTEPDQTALVDWAPYLHVEHDFTCDTTVPSETLRALGKQLLELPEFFALQRQVAKIMTDRQKMVDQQMPANWGFAETLAYASLLNEGFDVRITGQDVGRGTFSHRHAVLHDQKQHGVYVPLQHISDSTTMTIYDSFLSEEAVLGFEYGYSTTSPKTLVIWEAQFGDFANGAQVVIDQFITCGEHKWERLSGLVMLLPHGYEGQGPEHSSARLERYLQLCAEHNIQVAIPTTPAQIFHLLRRQAKRNLRKPLIVFTPKSLLRHKEAVSEFHALSSGTFLPVIGEIDKQIGVDQVTRVIICSGKVYYDLVEKREQHNINHIAIIRIEQLYPFPSDILCDAFKPYRNVSSVIWCQEEPKNQGAWFSMQHRFYAACHAVFPGVLVEYVGRDASASPSAGYMALHLKQQQALVNEALDLPTH